MRLLAGGGGGGGWNSSGDRVAVWLVPGCTDVEGRRHIRCHMGAGGCAGCCTWKDYLDYQLNTIDIEPQSMDPFGGYVPRNDLDEYCIDRRPYSYILRQPLWSPAPGRSGGGFPGQACHEPYDLGA